MKSEQEFYESFRPKIPGHLQRIETSTGSGVPDLVWCYDGRTIWIETKIELPSRGVLLRKEQYAWGHRHAAHKGRVIVLALMFDQQVAAWFFPKIDVIAVGKYLKIVSSPLFLETNASNLLLKVNA